MTPYEIISVCFGAISIICAIISSICAIVSIRKEKKVKEHLQTIINIKKEIQITSSKFNIKDSMNETTSNVFEGCNVNYYCFKDPSSISDGMIELHKKEDK